MFNKFDIAGMPQSSGILKLKMFQKQEEPKLKKMKMKVFNFLSKAAIACKILQQKS